MESLIDLNRVRDGNLIDAYPWSRRAKPRWAQVVCPWTRSISNQAVEDREELLHVHVRPADPVALHKRESIEAHPSIVMAALTISHRLERITDTSIKKIVQTLRRHRSIAVLPACRTWSPVRQLVRVGGWHPPPCG